MVQRIIISECQYKRLFLLGSDYINNLLFEQGWRGYGKNWKDMSDEEKELAYERAEKEDQELAEKYPELLRLSNKELVNKMITEKKKWIGLGIKPNTPEYWDSKDTELYRALSVFAKGEYDKSLIQHKTTELKQKTSKGYTEKLPGPFKVVDPIWWKSQPIAHQVYYYRHEIIDLLAVVSYFLGPVGVVTSIALEGLNAKLYYDDGDYVSGTLSLVFMLVPAGGPLLRRLTAPVIKNIAKYFQKIAKINNNMGLSDIAIKKEIQKLTQELSKTEREVVEKLMKDPENLNKIKNMSKKDIKKMALNNIKSDPALWKSYKSAEYGWKQGSRFLDELLNPTMLEKFIYAGAIIGGIYLDKSGKLQNFSEYVTRKLVELGWVDADISEEEKQAIEEDMNEVWEKYYTPDFGEITEEEREEMLIEMVSEIDTKMEFVDTIYKHDLPAKVELINSELDQKKIILNKLKNVPEVELRNFDNYKWAQLCKGKNKLSVSSNITPEIEEFLNDEMFNIRRIKNNNLGKDYEYASDEDGLWYFKKLNTTEWKLVTDCMALLKIETAMEKDLDSDIDTEGEIFDLYKDAVDIEYKDF